MNKIMRFKRGGKRWSKKDWRWKEKRVKEVKEYKYLKYMLQKNAGQEAYVKERIRKATAVWEIRIMGEVGGIRKRRFGRN